MDDVSVQHIGTLYAYCQGAAHFLDEIDLAAGQIEGLLEFLRADTYRNIDRIQDALSRYQSDVDDIKMEMDDLRDQKREEEDIDARRAISEDIQSCREELSEAREKVQQCEDDYLHAEVLRREIIYRISMLTSLLDELRNSVVTGTETSIDFVRKYARYLQNTTL